MLVRDVVRGRREIAPGRAQAPKASIVTPTYRRNLEGLLAPCIESALGQTFTDIELIIIDDGSSDGSEETIRDYARQDSRIRYFRHDANCGLPAVRTNEGIELARGDAVAFLFDDNVMAPDFMAQAHAALEETACDVVHADTHMLGRDGKDFMLGDWPLTIDFLGNLNTIPNGGVLCRRDFFDRFGLYDPHVLLRRICDWDLWLRAIHLGARFHHIATTASVEHGLVSDNSIGNTVAWDIKVAYGYMFDRQRYASRVARLGPGTIDDFDVLDPEAVLRYVRDADEWSAVVKAVYAPFAERNSEAANATITLTNRARLDAFGYSTRVSPSPLAGRRRIVIVSNTFNSCAREWEAALAQPETICIHVPEWNLAAIPGTSIDVLILIDACTPAILPAIKDCAAAGIAILYVSRYGFGDRVPDQETRTRHAPIYRLLGADIYIPKAGSPFSEMQSAHARTVMAFADAVVAPAEPDIPADCLAHGRVVGAPANPSPYWHRNVVASLAYGRRHAAEAQKCRPKAVIALNSELLSGSEAYGTMLASGLAGVGFSVEVWIPNVSTYGMPDDALGKRLATLRLPAARPAPYRTDPHFDDQPADARQAEIAALEEEIERSRADIVICSGLLPVFAAIARGNSALIMALFQPSAYEPSRLAGLAGRIDGWISDCRWSRDIIARVLTARSAVVRSTVPRLSPAAMARTRPEGPVRIALGGTLQPRKGQVESVRALRLVLDRGHDAVLNLYGYALPGLAWYREEIERTAERHGVEDRVRIHPLSDLDTIADENDIILSAALDESLPQTVAECMARGLIPVVALTGGLDELVIDGSNGFIAPSHDPEHLAGALERALRAQGDWPKLRRQSALVLSAFDGDRATEDLLCLLVKILDRPIAQLPATATEGAGTVSPTPLAFPLPNEARAARVADLLNRKAVLARQNGTG